jgi:hypothetical protein
MMITSERPGLLWVIYGILSIWLFLGSVAFAEQLNFLEETSSQDEEALLRLAFALNETVPPLESLIQPVRAVFADVLLGDSRVSVSVPVLSFPTLRPHQRISVYRI